MRQSVTLGSYNTAPQVVQAEIPRGIWQDQSGALDPSRMPPLAYDLSSPS